MKIEFVFIAAVLISTPLIWLLPKALRGKIMQITTLSVLIWIAPFSALTMLSVAALQWLVWEKLDFKLKKFGLLLTICLPLIPLLVYKLGYEIDNWILPLGLSYYAFRQIHVAFEIYKGRIARLSLGDYFQYLLFLPVILVGPIHRLPEFQRSLRRQKWQTSNFSDGLERILYGMVKISFLGNYLFSFKVPAVAVRVDQPFRFYLETMAFTGNAYVQFAGFSDLAIGMGLFWGIRVMENFDYPFLATNMQDFWQRWHISLSGWCRDYIFQPVAAYSRNRWVALAIAMVVLALWHEISLRYILWGVFHSILILATVWSRKNLPQVSQFINQNRVGKWIGRIWVLHLFAASCLLIGAAPAGEWAIKLNQLLK